ncbi:MAG: four helix bundle protein [Patescibacteria group bacterium]|nr:four helix bundle protein [Patescibacteria group bacterium]
MKENIAVEKSYAFALKVVKINYYLIDKKREFVLSKQMLRSGTSIGANLEEAAGAQSRADFIHKVHIALKETRETDYWIRLIRDSELLSLEEAELLREDCVEIVKILTKTLKTCKTNDSNKLQITNNK